jgi:hypothetical protein
MNLIVETWDSRRELEVARRILRVVLIERGDKERVKTKQWIFIVGNSRGG